MLNMTRTKLKNLLERYVPNINSEETWKEYLRLDESVDFGDIIHDLNMFLDEFGINLCFSEISEYCESYYEALTYINLFQEDNGITESGYFIFDSDVNISTDSYDDFIDDLLEYINRAEYIQSKLKNKR